MSHFSHLTREKLLISKCSTLLAGQEALAAVLELTSNCRCLGHRYTTYLQQDVHILDEVLRIASCLSHPPAS